MKILTEADIIKTGCGSSPRLYADGVVGLGAKLAAAQDIIAGKVVRFAVCDREQAGPPILREIITVGMGAGGDVAEGYQPRAPRFCGENGNPDGAGSHALIPSHYQYCGDGMAIAAALAQHLAQRARWCFRLPNLEPKAAA